MREVRFCEEVHLVFLYLPPAETSHKFQLISFLPSKYPQLIDIIIVWLLLLIDFGDLPDKNTKRGYSKTVRQ